jgi:hypothetical protein
MPADFNIEDKTSVITLDIGSAHGKAAQQTLHRKHIVTATQVT